MMPRKSGPWMRRDQGGLPRHQETALRRGSGAQPLAQRRNVLAATCVPRSSERLELGCPRSPGDPAGLCPDPEMARKGPPALPSPSQCLPLALRPARHRALHPRGHAPRQAPMTGRTPMRAPNLCEPIGWSTAPRRALRTRRRSGAQTPYAASGSRAARGSQAPVLVPRHAVLEAPPSESCPCCRRSLPSDRCRPKMSDIFLKFI